MRPDNRALAAILLAVVVLVAIGGAVVFLTALPSTLPISAGTVVNQNAYTVTFAVSGGLGRLVGSWYANHGGIVWIYPSDSPPGLMLLPCIMNAPWNGTANVSL